MTASTNGKDVVTNLGLGHPNLFLQNDYRGDKKWYARVETIVPIDPGDFDKVQEWFEMPDAGGFAAASYLADRVPAGNNPRAAKHMVAAAFGMELDSKGEKVVREKTDSTSQAIPMGDRSPTPRA
jgi:hypothetical protein